MKALICEKYGEPEDLNIREVNFPELKPEQVLVKIKATAINDYDWSMVRGKPLIYRLMFGLRRPKYPIPGMELSGVIEKTGGKANRFKIGDAVYGDTSEYGFGTFAEYMAINENALRLKPENMSFEDAVAIPHAGLLAYQGLEWIGQMETGQKILINGGGGGVGALAVQLAKQKNCEVHGVDTGSKLNEMKAWGFDQQIDYKKQNFSRLKEKYDLILDCKTSQLPIAYLKVLNAGGKYISVGGQLGKLFLLLITAKLISPFSRKSLKLLSLKPNLGLDQLEEINAVKALQPIIDGPYQLEDSPKLIRYFGEGKHSGKIVIRIK